MTMFSTVIIDDEQHCVDRLSRMLSDYHCNIKLTGTYPSVQSGLEGIREAKPDLVFLDVMLKGVSGFELLKQLEQVNFELVFTTADKNFALNAFKFSALDFLLKPVAQEELYATMQKLQYKVDYKLLDHKIDALMHTIDNLKSSAKKIMVPTLEGFTRLDVHDVIRCQSDGNYTRLFLASKQVMVVSKTLKEFEEILSEYNFFRVHNSHLINLNWIKSYHKGKGGYVVLDDDTEIEISSRKKAHFLKILMSM